MLEQFVERSLFACRWLLAPLFLGLGLALLALGIKFFQEAIHLILHIFTSSEADLVLTVLALIDIVLVGSLIVMVMFSGYENFVSRIEAKGTDTLGWLGKLDSGTLKLKVAASIVAISSIHLLRVFMNAAADRQRQDPVVRDPAPDLRRLGAAAGRARPDRVRRAPGAREGLTERQERNGTKELGEAGPGRHLGGGARRRSALDPRMRVAHAGLSGNPMLLVKITATGGAQIAVSTSYPVRM